MPSPRDPDSRDGRRQGGADALLLTLVGGVPLAVQRLPGSDETPAAQRELDAAVAKVLTNTTTTAASKAAPPAAHQATASTPPSSRSCTQARVTELCTRPLCSASADATSYRFVSAISAGSGGSMSSQSGRHDPRS